NAAALQQAVRLARPRPPRVNALLAPPTAMPAIANFYVGLETNMCAQAVGWASEGRHAPRATGRTRRRQRRMAESAAGAAAMTPSTALRAVRVAGPIPQQLAPWEQAAARTPRHALPDLSNEEKPCAR